MEDIDLRPQPTRQQREDVRVIRERQRLRIPTPSSRTIARATAAAGAASVVGAVTLGSNLPNSTTPVQPVTPIQPTTPITPIIPTTPIIPQQTPLIPEDTKQPEIPTDVLEEHFNNEAARKGLVGNYKLPVYGRHNYVEWTKYTEGNTQASAY